MDMVGYHMFSYTDLRLLNCNSNM